MFTFRKWWRHTRKTQVNTTKQPIDCWILTTDRAKTHRHTDKRRNGFLKHKRAKHFLLNLNNNANEASASWYDVTHDDDFRRIAILKKITKLLLLAFCGVVYQSLLHRRVYIAVSSSKLLFRQFCEKPLHITFKGGVHVTRGNYLRLNKSHAKYDLWKFDFPNRVVNIWTVFLTGLYLQTLLVRLKQD